MLQQQQMELHQAQMQYAAYAYAVCITLLLTFPAFRCLQESYGDIVTLIISRNY